MMTLVVLLIGRHALLKKIKGTLKNMRFQWGKIILNIYTDMEEKRPHRLMEMKTIDLQRVESK